MKDLWPGNKAAFKESYSAAGLKRKKHRESDAFFVQY